MEQVICSVYDSAAGMFLEPFFAPTVEFAMRGFKEAVNTDGHQFARFPEDYTLFKVGVWNPSEGMIENVIPVSLGVAITFVSQEVNFDA